MKKSLLQLNPASILVRSTNWIGDAVMTLPAIRTIRQNFPAARISILAHPWVADLFTANRYVDEVSIYQKRGEHAGVQGLFRLAGELRPLHFEAAILLQNAFEAALLARLAGIPVIAGYSRDARRLLLTHAASIRSEIRKKHQVYYYQDLLRQLGLSPGPDELYLELSEDIRQWASDFVEELRRPIIGLNPGAAYGPAKRWPAQKYASLTTRLAEATGGTIMVFGTEADRQAADTIGKKTSTLVDLTGRTSLKQAMGLIECLDVFVTNDSGLMHVAAAARTPLVAIFGSTDAVATGPFSDRAKVIQKDFACIPCLKPECKSDFRCMEEIQVGEVAEAVRGLLLKNTTDHKDNGRNRLVSSSNTVCFREVKFSGS